MSKRKTQSPKIDKRQFNDLLNKLLQLTPFYTPERVGASKDETDTGTALLNIFSYIAGHVINRLNQVPYKNFVAFLDMLGIQLLPAQSARVPMTFKLSDGTDKEILIPQRTQGAADATDEREEQPFETEKNLLAVPGLLKKVISIDPKNDAIYIPPPAFLKGEVPGQSPPTYKMVSPAKWGDKNIQLDHVTELEEGDFLKIEDDTNIEYVVISAISGTIVTITHSLKNDFGTGTSVEKLMEFALFEGKNMQEHSLYIGHKDVFNVKSKATFSLDFVIESGVMPTVGLSWEYWGEQEGEEGEDWRSFNIEVDGTNGLSTDGVITLVKDIEGEIKEKEINGLESRWIRCRVKDNLPNHVNEDESSQLPVLKEIKLNVSSSELAGDKLIPDQAFNNDIPLDLDITKSFNPFGTEPRMFDTFSIASQEIFSKKGADVTLNVEVEPRGIVGPPVAIKVTDTFDGVEKIIVFARGTYGRLVEVSFKYTLNEEPDWIDHGLPPSSSVAEGSTPAVEYDGYNIYVFVRTEEGKLVELFHNSKQWKWIEHDTPPGDDISFKSDPAAVFEKINQQISVFTADSEGNLYEFYRRPFEDDTVGEWINHGKPDGTSIDLSPYVGVDPFSKSEKTKVFVKGGDGNLYELECKAGTIDEDDWKTDYGSPDPGSVKVDSKPFAGVYSKGGNYYAVVYVKGDDDQLWEFDTKNPGPWQSLGSPDENIKVGSDPHGFISIEGSKPYEKRIFVRGEDGSLYEWNMEEKENNGWRVHGTPGNSKLKFSPFAIYIWSKETYCIFSASTQYSIIGRYIDSDNKIWNEYKDPYETAVTPTLSWEYWNNKGWVVIEGIKDLTSNLLKNRTISFKIQKNIAETEVAGQKNYWIRARLVGGDYGKETFSVSEKELGEQQLISTKNTIRPPIITNLTITYTYSDDEKQFPEQCLAYNNLEYRVCTDEVKTDDKHFSPFLRLEEKEETLYLGFDKFFKGGPIKIFFDAQELTFREDRNPKSEWRYSRKKDWKEMICNDYTEALIKADILEFIGSSDFSAQSIFGHYLYWLRVGFVRDTDDPMPRLRGIYPNTTWALQGMTVEDEILGSSSGEPNQAFTLLNFPVQKGEKVRVCETISREEKKALIKVGEEDAVKEIKDEKGEVLENWVLWTKVPDFFDSIDKDRHYILDPATGLLQFGDGVNGMIPQAGENNIKVFSYQAGGGSAGNVGAGEIKTLKSAVAGVDSVLNPTAADGGADTATNDEMLEIGPAIINYRNRAVTLEDFEWIAKQASRKIVKARCLPNTKNKKQEAVGWVSIIIVPDLLDAQPLPSPQLIRTVKKYLEAYSSNTLSAAQHIQVHGPDYSKIGISVQIFVNSIDAAGHVERAAREKLDAFFHPLTGGADGEGWDFGRNVPASDVYALLEDIEGVDHVEELTFILNGEPCKENIVEVNEDSLVSNGEHTINLQVKEGG
jgi:uncharacterized phage protein gp47/JayE